MARRAAATGVGSRSNAERLEKPIQQGSGEKKRHSATQTFTDVRGAVLATLSEKEFQRMVVEGLKQRGWTVWVVPDMRRTAAGLPDVIAAHPDRDVVLFLELKTTTGRVKPAQADAIKALQGKPGVYAAVVRPIDWLRLKGVV